MLPLCPAAPWMFCCILFCCSGLVMEEEVDRRNMKRERERERGRGRGERGEGGTDVRIIALRYRL